MLTITPVFANDEIDEAKGQKKKITKEYDLTTSSLINKAEGKLKLIKYDNGSFRLKTTGMTSKTKEPIGIVIYIDPVNDIYTAVDMSDEALSKELEITNSKENNELHESM